MSAEQKQALLKFLEQQPILKGLWSAERQHVINLCIKILGDHTNLVTPWLSQAYDLSYLPTREQFKAIQQVYNV